MADRVAVSIVLGGMLSEAEYMELAEIIDREGLSVEWDGPPFEPTYGADGAPDTSTAPFRHYAGGGSRGMGQALDG